MEAKSNPFHDQDKRVNAIGSEILSKNATGNEKNSEGSSDFCKNVTTVQAAAADIKAAHLSAFLVETELELMDLTYYFGRAFSAVSVAEFEWVKLFSDTPLNTIVDVPCCHIPEDVYHISANWIDKHSDEALKSFVIWLFKRIMSGMDTRKKLLGDSQKGAQNTSLKSQVRSLKLPIVRKTLSRDSQKDAHNTSSSQVEMFLMLSIALRRRPDVLINSLPLLRDDSKYQSQDKLPLFSWMIAQAAEGDITVGLYTWARNMLPVLGGKSSSNPKARDLVLQVVERIISVPNARNVLCQGATRNGERLISNSALELLLRLSFPADSARVKETERFKAIYSTLIYVALHVRGRVRERKQISQQIQRLALKLAGEETPDLSQVAARIFIWCLTLAPDCYDYWGDLYMDNLKASVVVLARLIHTWKVVSPRLSDLPTLCDTLNDFREQNKKACGEEGVDAAGLALIKESNEYCVRLLNMIFGKRCWWLAKKLFITIVIGTQIAVVINAFFQLFLFILF